MGLSAFIHALPTASNTYLSLHCKYTKDIPCSQMFQHKPLWAFMNTSFVHKYIHMCLALSYPHLYMRFIVNKKDLHVCQLWILQLFIYTLR